MISLGSFAATPFAAAYSASKFGLKGCSAALRAQLADYQDVHICDVYPSFVDTPAISYATAVAADGGLEKEVPAKGIGAGQQRRTRRQEVGCIPVLSITMPPNLFARRGRLSLAREECH
jgi:NAD(P)-dependent dehydrogenase (short-subunit alcohol dehydrogenase family)